MRAEAAPGLDPDPLGLIAAFLVLPTAGDSAEAVYLAWLVSLAPALDPAYAATLLLARPGLDEGAASAAAGRLLALLRETTRWPRAAIATLGRPGAGPCSREGEPA